MRGRDLTRLDHLKPAIKRVGDIAATGQSRVLQHEDSAFYFLGCGRHLGDLWRTLAVRHEQELYGPGLMVRNERGYPRGGDMQTSRRQILQCRSKIAVAHRHHLSSGALLQREHDVIRQTGSGSPIELAWPFTGDTNEIRERPHF